MAESQKRKKSTRNAATLSAAREAGLLGDGKGARLASGAASALIKAAKERSRVTSDTAVFELERSAMPLPASALQDDFGTKLLHRNGTVPRDIRLGLEP